MKKYIVYITHYTGHKLPEWYIGSTIKEKIKNGYNGSVSSKKYKEIYTLEQRENKHLFKTRILSYHNTREEAYREENRVQKLHNVVKNKKYYNESFAQEFGFKGGDTSEFIDYNNPEMKEKISQRSMERWNIKLGLFRDFEVLCSKCNNSIIINEREKTFPKKEKYFCSRKCANSRTQTKEMNISRSIKNKKYNMDNNIKPINNSKGTKYINKDNIIKRVKPEVLEKYISDGWQLGKLSKY